MNLRWLLLLWLGTVAPLALAADECVPFTRAGEMVGLETCVTGKILEVHTTRAGMTYLNFCRDYRDCDFSIVVSPHDLRRLGNVRILQGRDVRITGQVEQRNSRTQIAWHDANQLVVAVGDTPSAKGSHSSGSPPASPQSPARQ